MGDRFTVALGRLFSTLTWAIEVVVRPWESIAEMLQVTNSFGAVVVGVRMRVGAVVE